MILVTMRSDRPRWLARATGVALGLALLGATGLPGALAQDEGVTIGGGESPAVAPTASDIEALVNSILAEVFGETAVPDEELVVDDGTTIGGDINVGGNMGGSVTTGGGMGGGISIGGDSGGSSGSGGTVYGG